MRAAGNKLAAAEAQAEMVAKALDKEATMASVMSRIKPSSAAATGAMAAQQSPSSRPPSSSSSRPGSSRAQRLYSAAKRRPLSGSQSQPHQSQSRPASGTMRSQADRDAEQAYLDEVMREPAMGIQAAGGGRA